MKKRYYKVWILFLGKSSKCFWNWHEWMKIFDTIDPLVRHCPDKHVFDVLQSNNNKVINPRPLLWNKKNTEKWTHQSPTTKEVCIDWNFMQMRLQCPSEEQSDESKIPPDFFFSLDRVNYSEKVEPEVSQFIRMAIASDLIPETLDLANQTHEKLLKLTKPIFAVELNSRWLIRKTAVTSCTIGSNYSRGFFVSGWLGNNKPSIDDFDTEGANFEIIKIRYFDAKTCY